MNGTETTTTQAHTETLPAAPSRRQLEQAHGLLALEELSSAAAKLASLLQRGSFDQGDTRFGQLYGSLDKAMARIARLGTERSFELTGLNPIEEATRMAKYYADPKTYQLVNGTDSTVEAIVAPAKAFLRDFGVEIHSLKKA